MLGKKTESFSRPLECRIHRFEAERKKKTPEDVKLNVLQNGYLGFLLFSDFTLKLNIDFSKVDDYKSKFFELSKKRNICYKARYNTHTNFPSNIFTFCLCNGKKVGEGRENWDKFVSATLIWCSSKSKKGKTIFYYIN